MKGGERVEKKTSEARRRANDKWDAKNLKRLSLAMPIDEYDKMIDHIKETGEKQNRFIRRSIEETIKNDSEQ